MQADGSVAMVGIVQEQHPGRARLFMQWKQMDWPIMVDALNELGVAVVPITMFIDEHGIIRDMRPPRRDITAAVEAFVGTSFDPPEVAVAAPIAPDLDALQAATSDDNASAWRAYGTALVHWGGPTQCGEAIEALGRAVELDAGDGPSSFRLGVAYRRRVETESAQPGDFQDAVDHWGAALAINPNQYIWRRRIQQYGPRLDKPYPFYDWVTQARAEIEKRGETPHTLPVEPNGAEIAHPQRTFSASDIDAPEPDPDNRIHRDSRRFIVAEATVVPASVKPGTAVRVHLVFRPNASVAGHWNNEAEPMQVWVRPPDGWTVDRRSHTVPNASAPASLEIRRIEFELRVPDDAPAGLSQVYCYGLYNVCEGVDGACLYRRGEATIEIRVIGTD